ETAASKASASAGCSSAPALASNLLFAARSGQILHGISAAAAQARLSGTLIGLEIAGELQDAANGTTITLVASGRLRA
ncbi:2-dehydro-3-deoxygalactonokinase, partial [Rhizobium leguminosarum]|uniref:2-dehydro-3-deoxygalactonokinase n=1 Tax=Rhizobium leguminosarum TaxID=384 RepID=UPI003F9C581A